MSVKVATVQLFLC